MKQKMLLATGVLIFALATTVLADYGRDTVQQVQQALNDSGYDCGTPDGIAGEKTRIAITQYEEEKGLAITGEITDELLTVLGLGAEEENQKETASDAAEEASGMEDVQPAEEMQEDRSAEEQSLVEEVDPLIPDEVLAVVASMDMKAPEERIDIPMEPVPNDLGSRTSEHYERYEDGSLSKSKDYYFLYDEDGNVLIETVVEHNQYSQEELDAYQVMGMSVQEDVITAESYLYDENVNKIREADYQVEDWDGNDQPYARLTYYSYKTYDEDEKQINYVRVRAYDNTICGYTIPIFDESGAQVREYSYRTLREEAVAETYDIEMDDTGNIIKKTLVYNSNNGESVGESEVSGYDGEGRLISNVSYNADGSVKSEKEYTFEADGSYTLKEKGSTGTTTVTEFNAEGKEISYQKLDDNNALKETGETIYGEDGEVAEKYKYDADGTVKEHQFYEYDNEGRRIKRFTYEDANDEVLKSLYEYTY